MCGIIAFSIYSMMQILARTMSPEELKEQVGTLFLYPSWTKLMQGFVIVSIYALSLGTFITWFYVKIVYFLH